jgi:hypothetical protein
VSHIIALTVNHAGDSPENPLVTGLAFRLKIHKHGSSVTIRKCWISHGSASGEIVTELTSSVVEMDEEAYVDITVGTELRSSTPSMLNVIHWTTSDEVHEKRAVYCADRPPHEILLDGYDAQDPFKPYVIHRYL